MGSFKKNIGILLIIIGALLLIVPVIVPAAVDALDYNAYTISGVVLVLLGLIGHIFLNKYLPLDGDDE